MPARHTSPAVTSRNIMKALVDERGCRRDIRSNGWIVFRGSSLLQNRSGRRNEFSSFGAGLRRSAISPGPKPGVRSGPDVFADALVPRNASRSLGTSMFPGALAPIARTSVPGFNLPEFIFDCCGRGPIWDAGRPFSSPHPAKAGVRYTANSRSMTEAADCRVIRWSLSADGASRRPGARMMRPTLRQWLSFCQTAG